MLPHPHPFFLQLFFDRVYVFFLSAYLYFLSLYEIVVDKLFLRLRLYLSILSLDSWGNMILKAVFFLRFIDLKLVRLNHMSIGLIFIILLLSYSLCDDSFGSLNGFHYCYRRHEWRIILFKLLAYLFICFFAPLSLLSNYNCLVFDFLSWFFVFKFRLTFINSITWSYRF